MSASQSSSKLLQQMVWTLLWHSLVAVTFPQKCQSLFQFSHKRKPNTCGICKKQTSKQKKMTITNYIHPQVQDPQKEKHTHSNKYITILICTPTPSTSTHPQKRNISTAVPKSRFSSFQLKFPTQGVWQLCPLQYFHDLRHADEMPVDRLPRRGRRPGRTGRVPKTHLSMVAWSWKFKTAANFINCSTKILDI